ncbi:MAG TPA: CocE/NonD family hydrolase [Bryobacteraceae bacterium]|nr:CocE/NonD family hydrolase [Bryobacteraceae bacterium]
MRELDIAVPMRDGVRLSANIFRPAAARRYPTVLLRTAYNKGGDITPNFQSFVDRGYAVVVQDVRGRYQSEGVFEPINQEINDGDDTLNWIARQPWSDGNIGMYGGSYLGIAQWKAALSHNPHLKAIFPYVSGDDDYRDRFYSTGGAMKVGHRLLWLAENMRARGYEAPDFRKYIWMLPTRAADSLATGHTLALWQLAANHPAYDAFWKSVSVREHLKEIHVPVYSVGGWYDNYVESDLDAFSTLSKANHEDRIMIGPWPHTFNTPFANVNFGKDSIVPLRPEQLKWFDRWLKGKEVSEPSHPLRIFVMGINQWRDEDEWPLARARGVKFYLGGNGHANTLYGDGSLGEKPDRGSPADAFVYDPRNPVPTMGGAVCCDSRVYPWGPLDQRPVEKRRDVLVYTTPPLGSDLEVTGPIRVILYASSTAPDTDFTAKLIDVFPSGEARNLTDGILRVRYRDSLETPTLMTPGKVYRLAIDAGVTSNVFRAGHRIRLEISSSNFPRFDRNPNTGRPVASEKELRKAAQTVFHDRDRHSYVLLPVVPVVAHQLTSTRPPRYVTKRASAVAR